MMKEEQVSGGKWTSFGPREFMADRAEEYFLTFFISVGLLHMLLCQESWQILNLKSHIHFSSTYLNIWWNPGMENKGQPKSQN